MPRSSTFAELAAGFRELFYGWYFSAGITMPDENGSAVPELARRASLSSCRNDPVRAFVPVLTAMPGQGISLGDILDDCGYAHRDATGGGLFHVIREGASEGCEFVSREGAVVVLLGDGEAVPGSSTRSTAVSQPAHHKPHDPRRTYGVTR